MHCLRGCNHVFIISFLSWIRYIGKKKCLNNTSESEQTIGSVYWTWHPQIRLIFLMRPHHRTVNVTLGFNERTNNANSSQRRSYRALQILKWCYMNIYIVCVSMYISITWHGKQPTEGFLATTYWWRYLSIVYVTFWIYHALYRIYVNRYHTRCLSHTAEDTRLTPIIDITVGKELSIVKQGHSFSTALI